MDELIRFAVLGLGAGAVYGLAALAVVLVYRGSGVVNFASGATGMVGAFVFYNARADGQPTWWCWALALGLGLTIGLGIHFLLMRPLRHASALTRLVASLGVFILFVGIGNQRWPDASRPDRLLPADVVTLPGDLRVGSDRLLLLAIGVVLCTVLTVVYRWTRFGHATTAVAENRRASASLGISPDLVAAANWALGSMLSIVAAILIVNIASLSIITLTLLIIPALAAALLGEFRSFTLTLLGGLLIGVLESEAAYAQVQHPDWPLQGAGLTVPFLLIIVMLVVRGRSLPLRGEGEREPPRVGTGTVHPFLLATVALGAVLVCLIVSDSLLLGLTRSAAVGLIVLSLVVVTGYAGQVSLAQFAVAGLAAWMAAKAIIELGFPTELAVAFGVFGVAPVGILVGIPSLRTRGANLAVATLGLAAVIEVQIFNNAERVGGYRGLDIGRFELFGMDLDALEHPQRYALVASACLLVVSLLVANLRRSRGGRRLVAVRSNERAAAALGISVFGAKLFAFGLASSIAGLGGILLVFGRSPIVFRPTFSVFESVSAVLLAVLGGIGYIPGAAISAVLAAGGLAARGLGSVFEDQAQLQIVLSALVLVQLVALPDGIASIPDRLAGLRARLARPPRPRGAPEAAPTVVRVPPHALQLEGVTVRFGGVTAVDDLSLRVEPGEVVGLIGPNGAGKTTALDAATGFHRRQPGRVTIGDREVSRWSTARRARAGLGRSFQSLELFESMSVRDNLRAAADRRDPLAYVANLVVPERRRQPLPPAVAAAVHEFELEDDLDRPVSALPFGRRRLVSVARAVATAPSILLLDEPAAGLDRQESAELGRLTRRLAREWGMSVLIVEHDMELVFELCDRVVVLDYGRTIAQGTPADVRHDAAVRAAYLGDLDAERTTPAVAGPTSRATTACVSAVAPDTSHALIEADGLAAGYGDLAAARDIDLSVRAGEIVALLGPNGAGKTTTMLALAGELEPLAGTVRYRGRTPRASLTWRARHGLAFVPQERSIIHALTVRQNLRLAGRPVVAERLVFSELAALLSRRAGVLSGGEQQMLALERALLRDPDLLLVDELSQGLAPIVTQQLLATVRACADRGLGILLVEQYAHAAVEIADRVIVMARGRIQLSMDAGELRTDPARLEDAYLTAAGPER